MTYTFTLIPILLILNLGIFNHSPFSEYDQNECLVKTSSEWGSNCSACMNSKGSYRVNLRNECGTNLDVVVAVKEKTNRWRTFRVNNLAPGDSVSAYACDGAGKYTFWTRNAGDNKTMLPTDEEIQIEMSEKK
jgi:hypothetical protein